MNNRSIVAAHGQSLLLVVLLLIVGPAIGAKRDGPAVVPDNGYATGLPYGNGWACSFGYKPDDASCMLVEVPANAYLNSRGTGWKCNRGYRLDSYDSNQCQRIDVPANGYLTESSSQKGWACKRGFTASRETCERIAVPDNAYLTNSPVSPGWACERGYRMKGKSCQAIAVPDNAYLIEKNYGPGWRCARGYATRDDISCELLAVPEFAHLDSTGNDWQCNAPYTKRGKACVKS